MKENLERAARKLAMFIFDTWGDTEDVVWSGLSEKERERARSAARAVVALSPPGFREGIEAAAKVAEEHAESCRMSRSNAGAMNDRHAVWQAEAERLASESIASAIRSLAPTGEDGWMPIEEAQQIIGGLLDSGFQTGLVTRARRWLDRVEHQTPRAKEEG